MKKYTAREGYTFMKGDMIIGKEVYLGKNDSITFYKEVKDEDLPIIEEEVQGEIK